MGNTIPAGALILLDFIGSTEAPRGYGTIYGNNQAKLSLPLTSMTLSQVIEAGPGWSKRFGSSAAGRYQFMHATLVGLKQELGLTGAEIFDSALQDRLAMRLLERRGYELFVARAIDRVEFARRLAQEWASLPVLSACKGAHRMLTRGQSYYAGDGVNKALVAPERLEAVLDQVLELSGVAAPRTEPVEKAVAIPVVPKAIDKPLAKSWGFWERIASMLGLSGIASASWLGDWRVILALAFSLIVLVLIGVFLHARLIAAAKDIKAEIEEQA